VAENLSVIEQNIPPAVDSTRHTGETGERLAADFLSANGYRIVAANFKVPVGRNSRGAQVTGEIDLIALDGETLCFIEVKTRTSDSFASPISAIDLRKQRQITRTARIYRRIFGLRSTPVRYDAVSIVAAPGEVPRCELVKNFWTEGKFKKRSWIREAWQDFH
jgi:putative endonuclease